MTGPLSRSSTPSNYPSHPQHTSTNIAPQHLFDGVTMEGSPNGAYQNAHTHSPPFGHGGLHPSNLSAPPRNRSASPPNLHNGLSGHNGVETYESLVRQNNRLKTRVSELEVINDLFRGRVTELESNEAEARRALDDALRRLHHASARADEAERRERGGGGTGPNGEHHDGERTNKRLRMSMSDLIKDPERDEGEGEGEGERSGPETTERV